MRKKKVPTLESDYDTLEILADKEYAGLAGPLFGCIHVVEKSALDAAQAEIERLQKLHLQRTKDASVWLEERDALQTKCERLEREWEDAIKEQTRLGHVVYSKHEDWERMLMQAERLRETLEVVEPWLPRLSGIIGAISDAALRAQVRKALAAFEKFKRGGE